MLISQNQLATVRAALRYWRDEMIPNGSIAKHYFDKNEVAELTAADIEILLASFQSDAVRYIQVASDGRGIVTDAAPVYDSPNTGIVIFAKYTSDEA